MNVVILTLAAALATVVLINVLHRRADQDGRWHRFDETRMRRRMPDRSWQYRKMNDDEQEVALSQDAW